MKYNVFLPRHKRDTLHTPFPSLHCCRINFYNKRDEVRGGLRSNTLYSLMEWFSERTKEGQEISMAYISLAFYYSQRVA